MNEDEFLLLLLVKGIFVLWGQEGMFELQQQRCPVIWRGFGE
jgi:hypothetical protein